MFIVLWTMRQEREFLAHRANIQAVLGSGGNNNNAIQSAFEDLKEAWNPFLEGYKEEERKQILKRIEREVSRGPLSVIPMGNPISKSNTDIVKKKLKETFRENFKEVQNNFYSRRQR